MIIIFNTSHTGFKHKSTSSGNATLSLAPPQMTKQQKRLESFVNELEKFANCVPFKYVCPDCKTESHWQSPFAKIEAKEAAATAAAIFAETKMEEDEEIEFDESSLTHISAVRKPTDVSSLAAGAASSGQMHKCILDACANRACKLKPMSKLAYIKNLLTIQLNKYIKQYYQAWLVCDDPMCSFRSKRVSCKFFHGKPQCIECEKYNATLEYSHADLYYQMRFLRFVFDTEGYKNYYKDDAGSFYYCSIFF